MEQCSTTHHTIETPGGLFTLLDELCNNPIPFATASISLKDNVDFVLDELGVLDYFDTITYRDLVSIGKPNPELFLRAAAGLGIAPNHSLVFEDSASGFKAAIAAGMPYIAITYETDEHELTEAHDAAAIHAVFKEITTDANRSYVN